MSKTGHTGWIGVDLDGTLAMYDGWKGADHIGEPVPAMLERVQRWLAKGERVKIMTARVAKSDWRPDEAAIEHCRQVIQDWTEKHLGVRLPVTNVKDYSMLELWDDRAVQIIPNTGLRADGKP